MSVAPSGACTRLKILPSSYELGYNIPSLPRLVAFLCLTRPESPEMLVFPNSFSDA